MIFPPCPTRLFMPLRIIFLLWLAALGSACTGGASETMPANRPPMHSVRILALQDANKRSPVAVDLVYTSDMAVAQMLAQMDARLYFTQRHQLLKDFPGKILFVSWEVVPGQSITGRVQDQPQGWVAAFVFADYKTPGPHRFRVPATNNLVLYLTEQDVTLKSMEA